LTFPEPRKMLENIKSQRRKLVTIIDPHLKKDVDYFLYKLAEKEGALVKH